MSELKPCPYGCDAEIDEVHHRVFHHTGGIFLHDGQNEHCPLNGLWVHTQFWNNRPIEDALKEIVKNDGEKIEWFQSQLSDLTAKNEGVRKALIITRSHASDIRMTNIGFKPNGYDVVKTGQNIEDIAQAALEASA